MFNWTASNIKTIYRKHNFIVKFYLQFLRDIYAAFENSDRFQISLEIFRSRMSDSILTEIGCLNVLYSMFLFMHSQRVFEHMDATVGNSGNHKFLHDLGRDYVCVGHSRKHKSLFLSIPGTQNFTSNLSACAPISWPTYDRSRLCCVG